MMPPGLLTVVIAWQSPAPFMSLSALSTQLSPPSSLFSLPPVPISPRTAQPSRAKPFPDSLAQR